MHLLAQYGLFLSKMLTLGLTLLLVTGGLITLFTRNRRKSGNRLSLKKLNTKYRDLCTQLQQEILPKKAYKQWFKVTQRQFKAQTKQIKPRVFALHFMGDIKASEVDALREEITAVISIATPTDEVVVCLESGGGTVNGYGLGASQLQRLRDRNIPLTIIIDKIAASGGYMMACVANQIIAAPFAVIGSIGVVAQLPNFNRWLKKNSIDYEQLTAGKFKRTLTLFGENTELGRKKMQQELEVTHSLFKTFVKQYRPHIDLEKVATGEYWFGTQAIALNLIDATQTSDDYLLAASQTADVFALKYETKQSVAKRLGFNLQKFLGSLSSPI